MPARVRNGWDVKLPGLLAAALGVVMLGAAPLPTVYTAPAGDRQAGAPHPADPYDEVLPNGRISAPVGKSIVVGMRAQGVAVTPDGKFAIVSNDGSSGAAAISSIVPAVRGGYSLTVVDARTMHVTDVFHAEGASFFLGVAAERDPADPTQTLVVAAGGPSNSVRLFHLDGRGQLHEAAAPVAVPLAADPRFANDRQAFPGEIALSPNGATAYVVNNLADTVTAVNLRTRTVTHTVPVGYAPWDAAVAGRRLYVTDPGLMQYAKLPQPVSAPQFANVPFAPNQASAMNTVPLAADGDVVPSDILSTRMDVAPDGIQNVGGAHPTAIAVSKNLRYAYVCMTNVDRIAIVNLLGVPRVVGGLQLRLFDKSPYGAQPNAIVRSPDGKRLYVALAGMNAVAVIDSSNPRKLHRLGLIPTGWYPSAIAVSPNGRYVYVTNEQGAEDGDSTWSTLQRIDMHNLPLQKTTMSALRYLRVPKRPLANDVVPPLRSLRRSGVIKHVVFIMSQNKTYDAVLGDLTDAQGHAYGDEDPSLVTMGANVTPNLHALAKQFALATNFYAEGDDTNTVQFAGAGIATAYTEKMPFGAHEDPEDYPREGYIFNSAARAGLSYRDYGGFLSVSGYQPAQAQGAQGVPAGLGGSYSYDVPALGALTGHVDGDYPGWNPAISDVRRAQEFVRDYGALEKQNAVPDFTYVWLPPQQAADGDRALGTIVDFLTHQPSWRSTAIFITPDGPRTARDHVSIHRTYAIVVSPYAKRHYLGRAHLSTSSVLKTEEELLGLPPLSLGDLLATDMSGFFRTSADLTAFTQSAPPTGVERSARYDDPDR